MKFVSINVDEILQSEEIMLLSPPKVMNIIRVMRSVFTRKLEVFRQL